jgi:hypothetical protein
VELAAALCEQITSSAPPADRLHEPAAFDQLLDQRRRHAGEAAATRIARACFEPSRPNSPLHHFAEVM